MLFNWEGDKIKFRLAIRQNMLFNWEGGKIKFRLAEYFGCVERSVDAYYITSQKTYKPNQKRITLDDQNNWYWADPKWK